MKRTLFFGIIAALLSVAALAFVGCEGKNGGNSIVRYAGKVVYAGTSTPFPNLEVKITNGDKIHCLEHTNAEGQFVLTVNLDDINGDYYVLAGDSTCLPKRVNLPGFGQEQFDLGTIEVEGPSLPVVTTAKVSNITAESATCGGNVASDGRSSVTARGVCWAKTEYPTINDQHTTNGTGTGEFQSQLTELEHNAIYYVRAYATNSQGTAYGEQFKFTTTEGVAVVVTDSVYNITAHTAKCRAHVVSDGGFAVTKRGICWSNRPDPTIDDNITEEGSGLGEYTATLKDLVENTTYYVRAYSTNSTATAYGEQIIITTLDGLPVVRTDSVSSITANGFTCYGVVASDCDIPVTARGFVYATTQYPTVDDHIYTTSGKGLGTFKSVVSKLEYGTTYYIRAYATNATTTVYGAQVTVKTLSGMPIVTTAQVINIGSVRATCGGNVTDDGTLSVTARGVCYGTEQFPTIEGAHTTDGKGKGEFISALKDLKDKTTYYVRAYATTDAGTAYGEQRTFKTENGVPVVELKQVGSPTANSVTCTGNVTGDGGVDVTERGFCYSTSQYPTNTDAHLTVGNGIGEFSGSLTGLTINTTYYVRAYAVNSLGVGYSEQHSFTTQDGMPVVVTAVPSATATTINVGGEITGNGGYAVTERGVCYSNTNSEPTTADGKIESGKGNGAFSVSITGLTAATTYYLRAYAVNENGTAYGTAVAVTTQDGGAAVTIADIKNITALTASCSLTVTNAGGATLQGCGICWSTNPYPTIDDNKSMAGGIALNATYIVNMSDLQPNTTYYVRAFATTDVTTAYSEQKSFVTTIGLPILAVTTTTTTATSVVCNCEVTDNGGYTVTERGFCYSQTNSEPTISDTKIPNGSGNGRFSVNITGLLPSSSYYIRSYATNTNGTAYGEAVPVTTKDGIAAVTTGTITGLAALSAIGSVTITDAGGTTLQSCGICWATTPNPMITDNKTEAGGNALNTAYSCNMSSLNPNTTYYVRAYAVTDVAVSYGEQKTFTTTTGLPVVSTGTATSQATSVSVTGNVTANGGYSITERGVCYSNTNSEPSITDMKVVSGSGVGQFTASISSLEVSTQYYVRAYASNEIGTSYGKTITPVTKSGLATVALNDVTDIRTNAASGKITVTDVAGATLKSCGICWSTNVNPTVSDSKTEAGGKALNTKYQCEMQNLTSGVTYYVRAYAVTDIGTTYSATRQFVTLVNVSGTVRNESGQAISNASISFYDNTGGSKSVKSDSNGNFSVQLTPGTCNIEATAQGYSRLTKQVYVNKDDIIGLTMQQLGILSGKVYDDDNLPLANATITVKASDQSTLQAVSQSDGSYRIENIPLGETLSLSCSLNGYKMTSTIPNMAIKSGNHNLDIKLSIITPASCSISNLMFECSYEGQCGTTITKTFQIQNNRQKSVSWSMSGIPNKGLNFSPSSGTVAAKSSVIVTATFTYPGPSVSGSVKTMLYNCNQNGLYNYLWNWSTSGFGYYGCSSYCSQNVTIIIGNNPSEIEVTFWQGVAWY